MSHVTYLTDCYDKNAEARLAMAISSYMEASLTLVPIKNVAQAGMDLVDCLSATRIASGIKPRPRPELIPPPFQIVLANMARRELSQGAYQNGPPFCYFWVPGQTARQSPTLVVSTFTEELLGLAHRLELVEEVHLLDTREVLDWNISHNILSSGEADEIEGSQFRSLEFVPLVARQIQLGKEMPPSKLRHLGEPPRANGLALRIDNFGNVFTDVLPEEIDFNPGRILLLQDGRKIRCVEHLADVPKGELAAVIGSSGYGKRRFVMLTVQGGSAAKRLKVKKPGRPVIDACELAQLELSSSPL